MRRNSMGHIHKQMMGQVIARCPMCGSINVEKHIESTEKTASDFPTNTKPMFFRKKFVGIDFFFGPKYKTDYGKEYTPYLTCQDCRIRNIRERIRRAQRAAQR